MIIMKKWTKQIALALTLVLGTGLMAGCGSSEKIGYVDVTKIQLESVKSKQIQEMIATRQAEVVKKLQNDQKTKSPEEFAKEVQQTQNEMQVFQQAMIRELRNAMDATAADVARSKGLSIVVDSQAIPTGGEDITKEVLEKMNETANKDAEAKAKAQKTIEKAAKETDKK